MGTNNNGESDQKQAVKNLEKNTKNNAKKAYNKATKPVKDAKNAAKSYGKQMGKKAANNALKPAREAAKKAMEKAAQAAKKVAEQVGKALAKAAKALAKALAKAAKAIAEAIGKAIASMGPYGWIALAIILICVIAYGTAVYNSEKISFWFIGESTADGHIFDSVYLDDAIALKEALEKDSTNSIIGNDLPLLSKEDIIMILDYVIQYNKDMSFQVGIGVKYDEYGTSRSSVVGSQYITIEEALGVESIDKADQSIEAYQSLEPLISNKTSWYSKADNSSGYKIDTSIFTSGLWRDVLSENMSYGQIATLDIEGTEAEKYYNGTYDIDWKLLLILAEMMAESKAAQFGDNSNWTEEDQENLNNGGWFEYSKDGYYLTDEDITNLCKLFDYKIDCYPDDEGYDYVQIGKLYADDPYNSSNVVVNIDIDWLWPFGDGITRTYNEDIEHAYLSDTVKRMSYTLYPCTDVYGKQMWISQGIIRNDPNDTGKWTYVAPYATGYVFDGDGAITIDALGNTAVKYADQEGGIAYIMNNEEMLNYRAVKNMFVPYLAPRSIANVFMQAEYIYDDVGNIYEHTAEEYGMDEGTKALSRIEITIDGYNFYTQISELIPGFSFEHFFELYNYYKVTINEDDSTQTILKKQSYNTAIDMEIARWKNIEGLYNKAVAAEEEYIQCLTSGIAPPYTSLSEATREGEIKVTLPYTAISGPTGGKIFIGDYSQSRATSGSSATITGKNGVWIGESNGKRYYGFLPVSDYAKSTVNRQDAFIESENSFEELSLMCDELYHMIQEWGWETGIHIDDSGNHLYTEYTKHWWSPDCAGIWQSFCNCNPPASSDGRCRHGKNEDGHWGGFIDGEGHKVLVDYLLNWQKEHPDYSVTALVCLIAARAYMQDDPWIINCDGTCDDTNINTILQSTYLWDVCIITSNARGMGYDEWTIGECLACFNANTNMGYYDGDGAASGATLMTFFLDYEFNKIMTGQISKGQISYFDMEFGHGFNNTTIDQYAYKEQEIKYTYGNITTNPSATPWLSPKDVGVYETWWNDPLFPTENLGGNPDPFAHNYNIGWCNFAGDLRELVLEAAGYSCWGSGDWPLGVPLGENNVHISSPFGWRLLGDYQEHHGLDISCPEGTPVISVCDGYVNNYDYDTSGGGYMITIVGEDGRYYKYMHLTMNSCKEFVEIGEKVKKGQQIARSGNTGDSTGPHLHFQIQEGVTYINPAPYLGIDESNPYWTVRKTFETLEECQAAVRLGQYENKYFIWDGK